MIAVANPRGQIYRVTFKNTGNAHTYVRGQLAVQQGSNVVEQLNLADGQLVEAAAAIESSKWTGKKLPPGSYQAIAHTVDYGGKTETGGAIAFEVH